MAKATNTRTPADPRRTARQSASTRRMMARRRRLVAVLGLVLMVVLVTIVSHLGGDGGHAEDQQPAGQPIASEPPAAEVNEVPVRVPSPPAPAPDVVGAFTFAAGYGPRLGFSGVVRRFKVAVQTTLTDGDGRDFATRVDRILGDPRGWVAGRQFRLQRVPVSERAEFTVFLASAETSGKMCAAGGLRTAGFTSCRLPGQVIINQDRWQNAVAHYAAPLATYRAYVINHEVGHQFGYGHQACPGKGRRAPVMQQQTFGLKGCTANPWPYIAGRRYAGPPMP